MKLLDNRFRRRGVGIVYLTIFMTILCAFATFAVDLGRVQVAKMELRTASDAAARAATVKLAGGGSDVEVRSEAAAWAAANKVDCGQSLTLQSNGQGHDVEIGSWDSGAASPSFVVGGSSRNAVRVTARRNAARGTAVPLAFGKVIGQQTCDISAVSVAVYSAKSYGMVGLDFIAMTGRSSTSYFSTSASTSGQFGSIASNGSINLSGSAQVKGDARPGIGKLVYGANKVTGSTTPLTTVLSYPNGDPGIYATTNDNGNIPNTCMSGSSFNLGQNKTVTLPGGNYYFHNFDMGSGAQLTFTGPATIYCWGSFDMGSQTVTKDSLPKNLTIVMVPRNGNPPGSVSIGGGAALYATIYAPQSAITITGTGDLYGSVVGKSITLSGNGEVHYDLASSPGNGVVLVQ